MNRKTIDIIEKNVTVPQILSSHGIRVNKRIPCPIHHGTHLNFSVNDNWFCCFQCGAKGGVIQLEAALDGISQDEACNVIADRFGLDISYHKPTREERESWEIERRIEEDYNDYIKEKNTYYRGLATAYRCLGKQVRSGDWMAEDCFNSLGQWLDDNLDKVVQPWNM